MMKLKRPERRQSRTLGEVSLGGADRAPMLACPPEMQNSERPASTNDKNKVKKPER